MEKLRVVGAIVVEKGNEFFALDQIVEMAGFDRITVRRILEKLRREELVVTIAKKGAYQLESAGEVELGKGRPPLAITYHIRSKEKFIKRVGPKLKENTAQDKMWSVIRHKSRLEGSFSVRDVVVLAEVKHEHARWFVKMLRRAGYLSCSAPGGKGVTWTLIKDPGPKRPYISKHYAVGTKQQEDVTK